MCRRRGTHSSGAGSQLKCGQTMRPPRGNSPYCILYESAWEAGQFSWPAMRTSSEGATLIEKGFERRSSFGNDELTAFPAYCMLNFLRAEKPLSRRGRHAQ